jgi:hypothetical protein
MRRLRAEGEHRRETERFDLLDTPDERSSRPDRDTSNEKKTIPPKPQ